MSQAKGPSAASQSFMKTAAEGGQAEVDLAATAESKASNSQVKDLARTIKSDHESADAELQTLAGHKNVTLPSSPNAAHKALADRLSKLSGVAFDKAYATEMVKDHRADIAAFQKHQKDADPDVAAWVTKTLPTLENHLKMAEAAQKAVGGTGGK
jgi:putative membrane protein